MHLIKSIIVFISIVLVANASDFAACPGKSGANAIPLEVSITKCPKSECILKRNSHPKVEMKFTTSKNIKSVVHNVHAKILDVPLPFPGVDSTDACPYIYAEDGTTKVGCPLEGGKTYVYRNSFHILPVYPTVPLIVQYGITDGKNFVGCFELPARIK